MKETQQVTTYIKHLAISALSSILARIKLNCSLTGKYFEMPNVSYTQPLATSVKDRRADRNDSDK